MTFFPNFGAFHRTLQRVQLANRGRLLLRTPGPVTFGTCICSNVGTILSWTCHVYGPFEFRTSLGISLLFFIGVKGCLAVSLWLSQRGSHRMLICIQKWTCSLCGRAYFSISYRNTLIVSPPKSWLLLNVSHMVILHICLSIRSGIIWPTCLADFTMTYKA